MSSNQKKPSRLTPQELLRGRIPGALSLWQRARQGPVGPAAACDLVAIWAGLRRLAIESASDAQTRLDIAVASDTAALCAALASLGFRADDWRRRVDELDRDWDEDDIDEEELDWRAYQLFEELDRTSMAGWWLGTKTGNESEPVVRIASEVDLASAHLADNVIVFLSLGTDAAAVLSACRTDLEITEPGLWRTLLKHARIEAARDEVEYSPDRAKLVTALREGKRKWATGLPDGAESTATELQYAQAASGHAEDPLLREVGRPSPEDVPEADYTEAWARFLASTAQGSSVREAWLGRFLALARQQPLDGEWLARLQRAEDLAKERDWQRRFRGEQVLQLETRSFADLADLAGWLGTLVSAVAEDTPS